MLAFHDWAKANRLANDNKPWLILGKGPSYGNLKQADLENHHVLSLNHVVREQKVDLAHAIDIDVFQQISESFIQNAKMTVLPWIPHVKNKPGKKNLSELVSEIPALGKLIEENRLLFYNLSTAGPRISGSSPVIQVKYFSAEAAIRLVASVGVERIRTLGVDGGASYSDQFADLSDVTLLSNGRSSFDKQFDEFAGIIRDTGVDLAPLDIESPIRVYVATTEEQMLSVKVLSYSIRKHTSMSVQVFPMHYANITVPEPKDPKNRPRTPFSFQRFLIPELAKYNGRAIYLDSDMQVFQDLKRLWVQPFNGASLLAVKDSSSGGRVPQFSVMLMDCNSLGWKINEIIESLDNESLTYEELMFSMSIAENFERKIDSVWNSLESYEEGVTALVHYTDMTTQPWVYADHPLGYLWVRDLMAAINDGAIGLDYVKEHIELNYVRPSLLYQLEHGMEDGLLLPKRIKQLDKDFRAPYHSLTGGRAAPWNRKIAWAKAVSRNVFLKSGMNTVVRKLHARMFK